MNNHDQNGDNIVLNSGKKRNRRSNLTLSEKQAIYNLRCKKWTVSSIASKYNTSPSNITKICQEIKLIERKSQIKELVKGNTEDIDITCKELEVAKVEILELETRYTLDKIKVQNEMHQNIITDTEHSRQVMSRSTGIAMQSLDKAIQALDHSDATSILAIATAYEKIVTAQQKHMNTLLTVGTRYGIIDQTPKTALIDQSTHNNNNSMVMMNIPPPLTAEARQKMNDLAYKTNAVNTEICG